MLVDFTGKTGEIIRNNYKYFVIPLGFLFLIWTGFVILSIIEGPVSFEHKRLAVIYSAEETEKTLQDLAEKGYTRNLGPYYEEVIERLLAKHLGVMKYRLKANDNLWLLAKHFNINIDSIVGANSYLKSLTKLKLNQEIIIISEKGVLHKVKEKETVKSIASLYEITEKKLQDNYSQTRTIKKDDYIYIPGVEPVDMTEEMKAQYALARLFGPPIFNGGRKYTSKMKVRSDPFTGEKSFHDGVDIKAFSGDKICAVASGVVVFSGIYGGVGYIGKIKKDNRKKTMYRHNSKLYVVSGQKVKKGHIIAQAGSTGRSTGIHLHFTVWDRSGKLVDPTLMLSGTK